MIDHGEGWVEGIVREFEIDLYTLLYLKWMTNKILSYCIAQGTLLCALREPG